MLGRSVGYALNKKLDTNTSLKLIKLMDNISTTIETIKETILNHIPVKSMYLFGSYAYGEPTEESDIDIYLVLPDEVGKLLDIYAKIKVELSLKNIFLVDLLLNRESVFKDRVNKFYLEEAVYQKGKLIYENR